MKSYADWSARGKQLGWSENATSQAAYQGYVNKFDPKTGKLKTAAPAPSSPAPAPMQQAPTPSPQPAPQPAPQVQQLQQSVASLQSQIQSQADAFEAKMSALKPRDASKAFANTILTSPFGEKVKKKAQSFLTPFGG